MAAYWTPTRLLLLPLLLVASTSALRTAPSAARSAEPPKRGRLAVIICGLQDRFLWHSKVEQIVAPVARAGHAVDVYVDLVKSGAQDGRYAFSQVNGQVKSVEADVESLASVLEKNISDAGGRLAYFLARPRSEDLNLPTGRAAKRLPQRLWKYPPLSDPVGKNLLRRYQSASRLAGRAAKSGVPYDFVLWTRDDDHWLGPLDLDRFLADEKSTGRVYSKACLTWDGVNDKTLLFGRNATEAMLTRLYSDFWLHDQRLEPAKNAESFLKAFAEVKGVEPVAVPFGQLPTADSVFLQPKPGARPRLCQKERYLCGDLPAESGFERPVPCGSPPKVKAPPQPGQKTALVVVNYWVYPDTERRRVRGLALGRVLQSIAQYPVYVRSLLVTNEPAAEAEGFVDEQIVRPVQRCSPSLVDPLCMAWEAMRVLRNESTGGQPGCNLWKQGACGEPLYDYYVYLEGDIEMPPATFDFWSKHVDGLFKQRYILTPHRVEEFEGKQKLTDCVRCLSSSTSPACRSVIEKRRHVDDLTDTRVLHDAQGAAELYKDARDRVYIQPKSSYSACLLMSRWEFEVYRQGSMWDYDSVARTPGKIREAAIEGLQTDPRLRSLATLTHERLPVLHLQQMTGNGGLYPDMCNVADYHEKVQHCVADLRACPTL